MAAECFVYLMATEHIWQCLDFGLLEGALFSSEQLFASQPNAESKYLYALSLFRLNRLKAAARMLEHETYLPSVYLLGQCAVILGNYAPAIAGLERARPWTSASPPRGTPPPAIFQLMLGKLYKAQGDKTNAVYNLAQSARADPYLVENIVMLCQCPGFKVDVDACFGDSSAQSPAPRVQSSPIAFPHTPLVVNRRSDPATPRPRQQRRNITPTPLRTPENAPAPMAPRRRKIGPRKGLFGSLTASGDDSFLAPAPLFEEPEIDEAKTDVGKLAPVYRFYLNALAKFYLYDCAQAIKLLDQIPGPNQKTGSVLALLAKCHFESMDYKRSALVFQKLRKLDPLRVQDMEVYSTVLWQLKSKAELGFLAHDLTSIDRESWQAWCVTGNSFSSQNDSANALECFTRAIQLNSHCAIAFSLKGHEYLLNEEYQHAQDAFRSAIREDRRLYNAWFGLGMVYFKLADIDQAESHFTQAIKINPHNAVLYCFMGTIYEEKDDPVKAFQQFKKAAQLQPNNPIARFKLGRAYMLAKNYQDAIAELEYLKDIAPEDASVFLELGRVYRLTGHMTKAVKYLSTAQSLDPKLAQEIRHELGQTVTTLRQDDEGFMGRIN